jgi:hypothetical protein
MFVMKAVLTTNTILDFAQFLKCLAVGLGQAFKDFIAFFLQKWFQRKNDLNLLKCSKVLSAVLTTWVRLELAQVLTDYARLSLNSRFL